MYKMGNKVMPRTRAQARRIFVASPPLQVVIFFVLQTAALSQCH
jgi:hypothetical protein